MGVDGGAAAAWLAPLAPVAWLGTGLVAVLVMTAWQVRREEPHARTVVTYTALVMLGVLLALGPRIPRPPP